MVCSGTSPVRRRPVHPSPRPPSGNLTEAVCASPRSPTRPTTSTCLWKPSAPIRKEGTMNRGIIGLIIGVLVIIVLVLVILRLT